MRWILRLVRRIRVQREIDALMSADWLKDQDRLSARIEWHGVPIRWPIGKD